MQLTQEHLLKISLTLKLRQSSGVAFQDFFSNVMEKLHGDDFIRVRSFGQKGDKGCDGYLLSSGKVYQCYGAVNGDKGKASYLIGKMEEDFEKAKENLSSIMKEWYMVHNLVDGLPVDAVETLGKLKEANPQIHFAFIGPEGFETRISSLATNVAECLLGPLAMNEDAQNLQVEELRDIIKRLVDTIDRSEPNLEEITPVPIDKLNANDLPNYWKIIIASGRKNAHIVVAYIDQHNNPLIGEEIAQIFNDRYRYIKAQDLEPGCIMDALYQFVVGLGSVATARQVASHALLAHLFESCDIFENVTEEEEP